MFINLVKVLPFIPTLVDTSITLDGNTYSFKYSKNSPIPDEIATMMTKSDDNPTPVTTKLFMGLGSASKSLQDITKVLKDLNIRHHKIDIKKTEGILRVFVHAFSAQYAKTGFDKKDQICDALGLDPSNVQFGFASERVVREKKPVRKENALSKTIYMGFGENQISEATIRESLAAQDIPVLGITLRETQNVRKKYMAFIKTDSYESVRKATSQMMKTGLAESFSIDSDDFIVNAK